ncbi:MAG: tripartite tricarboxylate transporter substrate binding protein [Betaproteobacteria bacterium]|nr:tripartite tricarboxylate transporter substrate binding protein [Betaproteobacteria bacterium]
MTSNFVRRLCAAMLLLAAGGALAQAYPNRPIKLIAPYPPGGTTDIVARAVGNKLSEALGQPVVVENKTGAGGLIGHDFVAKAAPDGYTLLLGNSASLAVSVSMYAKMPYNPITDFAPITELAAGQLVLVAHPGLNVTNVAQLIELAKTKQGSLNAGLSAVGSIHHRLTESMKFTAGVKWTNVPYKGSGPMLTDLIGGQTDFAFDNIPSSLQFIKAGKLRGLAVSGTVRTPLLPDLPTLIESGLAGVEGVAWHGLLAPPGTPKAIIDRLHAEAVKVLRAPEMVTYLAGLGLDGIGNTPAEFAAFIRDENVKWAKVAKEAGAKIE